MSCRGEDITSYAAKNSGDFWLKLINFSIWVFRTLGPGFRVTLMHLVVGRGGGVTMTVVGSWFPETKRACGGSTALPVKCAVCRVEF